MADFNALLAAADIDIDIQAIEVISNQPTVRTISLSGRQQVRSFAGQYWTMRIIMPPMDEATLRQVYGFLIKQQGGFSTFTIAPTNLKNTGNRLGTLYPAATEDIKATTSTPQKALGSTSVEMTNQNRWFGGEMFKFSNHDKVYMITAEQSTDDTIFFEPGLTTVITDSHNILSGDLFEMKVRLVGDEFKFNETSDGYGSLEFEVVEAV